MICVKTLKMKRLYFITLFLFGMHFCSAQVGINTSTPNINAALDIESTTAGVLIPRMDTSQRNAIPNVQGMLVYDTDIDSFQYNTGSNWVRVVGTTASTSITQAGTFNLGATTDDDWQYNDIIFATPFPSAPSVSLTFREGTGIDNSGSNSVDQLKVANVSSTGFTIAIYDSARTSDVFIDWIATSRTQ